MAGKIVEIDRTTVMRRHRRDGSEAAVIPAALANDGWLHDGPT